ncbi:MAG: HPr(Ser) kinase/phosphatase [Candidatus Marinimicrobia bacterium CG08_land_8_20_14_0_20_45_22]|nr:MAG: HPr(Ser) kinase/phosphatase [Candidatus Marinimicrobia bacterium CG08_land_8_20_14_0_20_45_22]
MENYLTVENLFKDNRKKLRLSRINDGVGQERLIKSSKMNRPGLELSGFWDYFDKARIQLFGMKEKKYLDTLSEDGRISIFTKLFSTEIPAAIFAHGTKPFPEAISFANTHNISLMSTPLTTSHIVSQMMDYLDWHLAPTTVIHGSLVDVYGVGILFTGRSGIGKSEITLDLVERGQRLVADDLVKIIRRADNVIIGTGLENHEHLLEIRGLGIVDVKSVFGIRAIRQQKRIEVLVELLDWDENMAYERVGATQKSTKILGVAASYIKLPIYPGKNITVIAEVIALNHILNFMGKNAAKEFQKKLLATIRKKTQQNDLESYLKKDYE